ncbi:hypothetical protein DB346_18005 [Verrucomicrobia bacterium LW23]|nr:hypothetical protein DB346_18005 [Verrucomicrobia bacterium LW23]
MADVAHKQGCASAGGFSRELTFKLECRRAVAAGILETAFTTFLLLIAVRHFGAGSIAKGLLATGGAGGQLLAPVAVYVASQQGWTASRAASMLLSVAAGCFFFSAMTPGVEVFVALCVIGMISASMAVPFFTQIVQDNYPEHERGRLFSATSMIRIASTAIFSLAAGAALWGRLSWFPVLLLIYAAAFGLSAWYISRCPSRVIGDDIEHREDDAAPVPPDFERDRESAQALRMADEAVHAGDTDEAREAGQAAGVVAVSPMHTDRKEEEAAAAASPQRKQRGFWSAWSVVAEDPVFRLTLISWMFMGISNLMMLSLRVEYLAAERYGLHLDEVSIALLNSVLPSIARFSLSSVWGRLFDTMNFFLMRIILNGCFALSILTFFTGTSTLGLVVGSLIFGVATAGGDVTWSLWVTKFAPAHRVADYMAVHTSLTGLRGILAPLIAFTSVEFFSVQTMALVAGGLILVASILLVPEMLSERKARAAGKGRW